MLSHCLYGKKAELIFKKFIFILYKLDIPKCTRPLYYNWSTKASKNALCCFVTSFRKKTIDEYN